MSTQTGIDCLVPIVVGAHPRAEVSDRPLAARLIGRMNAWLDAGGHRAAPPLPCCDLWYLNDQELRLGPAVCIGTPEVNAATAFLAGRLPTAFVHDGRLRIHLDVELVDLRACLWGVDEDASAAAVDVFCERYLDAFLEEVLGAS